MDNSLKKVKSTINFELQKKKKKSILSKADFVEKIRFSIIVDFEQRVTLY